METAGLGVGIVGLVSVCLELIERFDTYKSFGVDSQHLINRYEAKKLRLKEWAKAVGISSGPLAKVHNTRLDDHEVARVVRPILQNLQDVLRNIQESRSRIGSRRMGAHHSASTMSIALDGGQKDDRSRGDLESKREGFHWTIKGRAQFTSQVEMMSILVDQLYEIVPPDAEISLVHQTIKSCLDISQLLSSYQERVDLLQEQCTRSYMRDARKSIKKWLDIVKDEERYEKYLADRLEGTCTWILDDPGYRNWASSEPADNPAKVFWINGPAGHGKSVLCAWLIQELKTSRHADVAYFFSSNEVQTGGNVIAILRLWLAQLVEQNDTIFDVVHQSMETSSRAQIASASEVWTTFAAVVVAVDNLVLVLDGFDEFSQVNDSRRLFLQKLKGAIDNSRTRCLITSRAEPDIESELHAARQIPASVTYCECRLSLNKLGSDLRLFSDRIVDSQLPRKSESLRRGLAETLTNRSEGMFLWIKLQQDQLRGGKSDRMLRKVVESMPIGLNQYFERNWSTIQNRPDYDRQRAVSILRWVTFARRPLTLIEITEALVVEYSTESDIFPFEDMPDEINEEYVEGEIKALCGSFVEVSTTGSDCSSSDGILSTVHVSVQQYLASVLPVPMYTGPSNRSTAPHHVPSAHDALLARVCLQLLNYRRVIHLKDQPEHNLNIALLEYASENWLYHVSSCKDHATQLEGVLSRFFSPFNPSFDLWAEQYESTLRKAINVKDDDFNKQPQATSSEGAEVSAQAKGSWPGFYYASLLGFTSVMLHLHKLRLANIDKEYPLCFGTALQAACVKGHKEALDLLLEWGADVNILAGRFGSAIGAAAFIGDENVIRVLLIRGADVNLSNRRGTTPLMFACGENRPNVVALLVDAGAEVNVCNKYGTTPLLAAASGGSQSEVNLLLRRGADITATDKDGEGAVFVAAANGHADVLVTLIEEKACVSCPTSSGATALHESAYKGHLDIVKILCSNGADIAVADKSGWTPLCAATQGGDLETVRELLNRGADMSVTTAKGSGPLFIAADRGYVNIMKLFLDSGAPVSDQFADWGMSLHAAANKGHSDAVRLLLEYRSDVSATTTKKWTALHLAASGGHLGVVKELIQHGADVSAPDDNGCTPLHLATNDGHHETVRLLLESGADCLAVTGKGYSSLQIAAWKGYQEIVAEFIDRGALLSTTSLHGSKCLVEAIQKGHLDVFRLLLDQGADISETTEAGYGLLHLASGNGHLQIVKELLRAGADKSFNVKGTTPMHVAVEFNHYDILIELLNEVPITSAADIDSLQLLNLAAGYGNVEMINHLIQRGAKMSIGDEYGRTPLLLAASYGHIPAVDVLLAHGASDLPDSGSPTSLHHAVRNSHIEMVTKLIEAGIEINRQDGSGFTPLHLAVTLGFDDIYQLLVNAGAGQTIIDLYGRSALDWMRLLGTSNLKESFLPDDISRDATATRINLHLDQLLMKVSQQLLDVGPKKVGTHGMLILGHCYIYLGKYEEATYAMQQGITKIDEANVPSHDVICDLCGMCPIKGTRYVCKLCPDIDVCSYCVEKIPEQDVNRACRGHSFLEVPVPASMLSSRQCPGWKLTPESRAWLEEIVKKGKQGEEAALPIR